MSRLPNLGNGSNGSHRCWNAVDIDLGVDFTIGVLLRAIARDMTGLAALITGLAGSVERTAVGSSAITRDMSQLATGVALHGLSLTVTSKVVGTTALVARGRAGTAGEATTAAKTATIAASGDGWPTTANSSGSNGVGACALHQKVSTVIKTARQMSPLEQPESAITYSQVTRLATVVASTAGAGTAQAESRAVSLDVAKTLAVVTLLGLGAARKRAAIGLVARLLAVVTEALSGRADLSVVANIATLIASTSRERRHLDR